jgi:hypothetical protein
MSAKKILRRKRLTHWKKVYQPSSVVFASALRPLQSGTASSGLVLDNPRPLEASFPANTW